MSAPTSISLSSAAETTLLPGLLGRLPPGRALGMDHGVRFSAWQWALSPIFAWHDTALRITPNNHTHGPISRLNDISDDFPTGTPPNTTTVRKGLIAAGTHRSGCRLPD